MILTEDKRYSMSLDLEDCVNVTGVNRKTVELSFTNKELLHAVITCGIPMQRLTTEYLNKRKMEILYKIFLVETALEAEGDRLKKSMRTSYLDASEKSVISYYIGMFFTKLISKRTFDIDYLTHLCMIEDRYGNGFITYYQRNRRPDMVGYRRADDSWSVWEAKGGSNNRQRALKKGCEQVAEIAAVNGKKPHPAAVCMTYYTRGYLHAIVRNPESRWGDNIRISRECIYRSYYGPIRKLLMECEKELVQKQEDIELEITIPHFVQMENGDTDRVICLGMPMPVFDGIMREEYGQLHEYFCEERMTPYEDRFMGPDAIFIR